MSDAIVLVGLPGAGKSTVGRMLASAMRRPFVDTDAIVAGAGGDVARRFRQMGEAGFREAETRAIAEALGQPGAVIATGGGALEDPLNRWRLWRNGTVVWLDAPDATLLARLARDPVHRPLLDRTPTDQLAALRSARAPFYRAARFQVDASPPPPAVCDAIMSMLGTPSRPAGLRLFDAQVERHHVIGPGSARVVYGWGLLRPILDEVIGQAGGSPRYVVDRKLDLRDVLDVPQQAHRLQGGETAKRFARLQQLLGWLSERRTERGDPVVAVGGGSVTDVTGLAAALHGRGTPWICVPTTLLAQADAALGGKVAVNLPAAKNAVGAFWPPSAVVADVAALSTLPPREVRTGMAEAVKAALVGDPALWRLLEERGVAAQGDDPEARYAIVERAARVKLAIVDRDPFETGQRRLLNLGHTVGHAIEVARRYRIAHGSAVAVGLRAAAALAARRGGDPDLGSRLGDLLRDLRLPTTIDADPAAIRAAISADKKRHAGRQRWLLPMAVGTVVEVDDVTDTELDAALHAIVSRA